MTLRRVPKTLNLSPLPSLTHFSSSFTAAAIILQLASQKAEYWGDEAREWRGSLVCTPRRGCGAFQTPLPTPPSTALPLLSLTFCLSVHLSVSLCLLYRGLGSWPVWAPCHRSGYSMYSLPRASYLIFVFLLPCSLPGFGCIVFFFNLRLRFNVWQPLRSQGLHVAGLG